MVELLSEVGGSLRMKSGGDSAVIKSQLRPEKSDEKPRVFWGREACASRSTRLGLGGSDLVVGGWGSGCGNYGLEL